MKRILLLGILLIGIVMAPYGSNENGGAVMEVGESVGADNDLPEPTLYEDETEDGPGMMVREQEREQEMEQEHAGEGQGISAQVHQIIQYRKNDTLDVPQGQVVRIVAQNRVVEVDNESIPLNATLRVRLRVQEQEHVLAFNGTEEEEEIEVEEEGTRVRTKETLQIRNREMLVGGVNVTVLPAEIQERIRLKKMDHVRLYVQNGNPYYDVNGTKAGKLLWLFDVDVPVQAQVHAQTGNVEKQQGPWWAFIVAYQE